jgi:hypothetical protein
VCDRAHMFGEGRKAMKKTLLTAIAGFALALSNFAFAQSSDHKVVAAAWAALDVSTPSSDSGTVRMIGWVEGDADAGAPPLISSFIAVSATQTGLPCFSCAPDPPLSGSIGLSIPPGSIPTSDEQLTYAYMFTDISVTGSCTVSFALVQGTKVLDHDSVAANLTPGSIWLVNFPRNFPKGFKGTAQAVGMVKCGADKTSVTTSVYLQ